MKKDIIMYQKEDNDISPCGIDGKTDMCIKSVYVK